MAVRPGLDWPPGIATSVVRCADARTVVGESSRCVADETLSFFVSRLMSLKRFPPGTLLQNYSTAAEKIKEESPKASNIIFSSCYALAPIPRSSNQESEKDDRFPGTWHLGEKN
jgi:hypothetical protein